MQLPPVDVKTLEEDEDEIFKLWVLISQQMKIALHQKVFSISSFKDVQ